MVKNAYFGPKNDIISRIFYLKYSQSYYNTAILLFTNKKFTICWGCLQTFKAGKCIRTTMRGFATCKMCLKSSCTSSSARTFETDFTMHGRFTMLNQRASQNRSTFSPDKKWLHHISNCALSSRKFCVTKHFLQRPMHCETCGSNSIQICCFVSVGTGMVTCCSTG